MDLRQLRHFRQVTESGSISAASAVLHIAQPALSRQIQALEEELGADLFYRTGRGVKLTAAGRALLDESRQLLAEADRVSQRIRNFGSRLRGEATIGLSPTIGRLITLPLAMRVEADFPDLCLRIAEGFSGTLLEWLQTGRIDAAVIYDKSARPGIYSQAVAREPLSVIGSASAPSFPIGSVVKMAALAGRRLVLPTPAHGLRKMVDQHAGSAGVELDVAYEFDSLDALLSTVRLGTGLTILPESVLSGDLDRRQFAAWRIAEPAVDRMLVIATAAQRADAIGVAQIAALLRQEITVAAYRYGWTLCAG